MFYLVKRKHYKHCLVWKEILFSDYSVNIASALTMFNPKPHFSYKNLIYKKNAEWVKLDLDGARSEHMCYDLFDKSDISSSVSCNSLCRSALLKRPLTSFWGLVLLNIEAFLEDATLAFILSASPWAWITFFDVFLGVAAPVLPSSSSECKSWKIFQLVIWCNSINRMNTFWLYNISQCQQNASINKCHLTQQRNFKIQSLIVKRVPGIGHYAYTIVFLASSILSGIN